MSTMLAKIQIHPGKETEFEEVMAYMYNQTHGHEQGILRYEYWRGRKAGNYYCLLSFADNLAFWRHQASDHHEGQMARFADCIAELDLETVDPVAQASPLPPTNTQEVPEDESDMVKTQAAEFPIELANWWLAQRKA
ncbi:MAG: antibiotic biosynthesis monooxygenase [Halioglobus sp.]